MHAWATDWITGYVTFGGNNIHCNILQQLHHAVAVHVTKEPK